MSRFDSLQTLPGARIEWPGGGESQQIELRINGTPLLELVRAVELPLAELERDGSGGADRSPQAPAGDYLYLSPSDTFFPSRNLYGAAYQHGFDVGPTDSSRGKSVLLTCTCGIPDCWFLLAKIEVDQERVVWSAFEQFHRDWDYSALGPFVFERAAYDGALRKRVPG